MVLLLFLRQRVCTQGNITGVVHALWDGAVCAQKQSSELIVRKEQWVRMIWIVWR